MPKTTSPRWIVLPSCRDSDFWQKALFELAAEKGLSIAYAGKQTASTDLILTDNAQTARDNAVDLNHVVAIISQAGPLSAEMEGLAPNPHRHQFTVLSTELMRSAFQDLNGRYIRADAFLKGPVALFDDLVMHRPDVDITQGSRRNRALVQAMDIYEKNEAIWSTDILELYAREIEVGPDYRRFDATGKPRFMAHGPYISMPAGQWQAVFKIQFDRALINKTYRIDWGGVSEFQEFVFKPEKPGLYEIKMDWTWEQVGACEIRLAAMEGVFDGSFILHDIHVSRMA